MVSFIEFFHLNSMEITAIQLSLKVALISVLCSLPLAIWIAWLLARKDFVGKSLLNAIVHLPLVLPPVVTGYLLLLTFGRRGVIGQYLDCWFDFSFAFNWKGAALASAVVSFPLIVRAIRIALEGVDYKLEHAARTLGAGSWRIFLTITLPLTLPGIIAGIVLGFARSLGEFGATITFVSNIAGETQTIPLAMYSLIETIGGESGAAKLCIIAIVISLVSIFSSEWLARRNRLKHGGVHAKG